MEIFEEILGSNGILHKQWKFWWVSFIYLSIKQCIEPIAIPNFLICTYHFEKKDYWNYLPSLFVDRIPNNILLIGN